jgi:hypothetical protein
VMRRLHGGDSLPKEPKKSLGSPLPELRAPLRPGTR